ncbi:hypothetical protein ACES2L_15920 [Bdellovibrio bacteriovorus]
MRIFFYISLMIGFTVPAFGQELSMACSAYLDKCERVPEPLKLAADTCAIEQKISGCEELVKKDPETAPYIRKCDAKSVCDQAANKSLDQLKGCFSGTVEIAKEFWDAVSSVPDLAGKGADAIKACWQSEECRSNVYNSSVKNAAYTSMLMNPILAPLVWIYMKKTNQVNEDDLKKLADVSRGLIEKGKEYIEKQGLKLACYDAKTQAEMVCYGVFSVVNPAGAAGILAKTPKLAKIIKAAGSPTAKASEATVDLARAARLTNAERVLEAERITGRKLTPDQEAALIKAHEVAKDTGRGYGSYSAADLREKSEILRSAGFTDQERDQLLRQGIAGMYSNAQQAHVYANTARLQADKLRVAGKIDESTASYRNAADSYEVYIKDPKVQKSERDYLVGAGLNAHAGRYDKAADYFLASKNSISRSDQKAEAVFEALRREKDELRVIAARNPENRGAKKAYEDHRKMIEAVVNHPQFKLGDSWRAELLKP